MIKCPKCESEKVIIKVFGMPAASEEEMADEGGFYKVEFEGCTVDGTENDRSCVECHHQWQFLGEDEG